MRYFFLSLIVCLSFSPAYSFDPLNELFANRPWDFLEDQFIIQPQNHMQETTTKLKTWLPSLAAGAVSGYATDSLIQNYVPKESGNFHVQSFARWTVNPIVGFGVARVLYKFIENSIQTNTEIATLHRFIRNWPFNKDYT